MSNLLVQNIKHTNGTASATVSTDGTFASVGHVIQTQFHSFTTLTNTTSTSYVDVGGSSFTFTPKLASSVLHISYSVHAYSFRSSDDNGGSVDINVDGSNISASGDGREMMIAIGGSSSIAIFARLHKLVTVSASNTNAKTIKLQMQTFTSADSGGFRINDGSNYTSSIKVEEIAQ
tara:strand:+ start:176 stop:703 length:528 start_codon:yes stop_codon:yes gene_type:complete